MLTIIIATLNCASELEQCLSCIAEQVDEKTQVIIVDGGSTDGTLDIIKAYDDLIDTWSSKPDHGVYDAWNRALCFVRGEWVLFMGADDRLYERNTLQKARTALCSLPNNVLISYGAVSMSQKDGTEVILGNDWRNSSKAIRAKMPIPHQGVFHRAELFSTGRAFAAEFKIAGDYEMLLHAVSKGDVIWIPNLVVMKQGVTGMSSMRSNRVLILREYREIQKRYGYKVELSWIFAMVKGYIWLLVNKFVSVAR